jgi:hypothetical protein
MADSGIVCIMNAVCNLPYSNGRKLPYSADRIGRHIIGPAQFPNRLTFRLALPYFVLLMGRQLVLPTHSNTAPLSSFAAFGSPANLNAETGIYSLLVYNQNGGIIRI